MKDKRRKPMRLSGVTIRVAGQNLRVVFTKERQILNRVEHRAILDTQRNELRLCGEIRGLVCDAIREMRQSRQPVS